MLCIVTPDLNRQEYATLGRALRAAGLRDEDVTIMAPGDNRCLVYDVIVALGDHAFKAVMNHVHDTDVPDVREARGYIWPTSWGKRCIPSLSLRDIEREWVPWRVLLDLDMKKAAAEAAALEPLPSYEVTLVTSPRDVQALFAEIQRTMQSGVVGSGGLLALDIENHEDMTLACIGIALGEREAFVLPTARMMPSWQRAALKALCALNAPKVFQNGAYDRYFLRKFYQLEVRGHSFDTMLAWHALQPELAGKTTKPRGHRQTAKSLRFLASIYTRAPWWKDYAFGDEHERYELCGRDCCITLEIAQKMARELEA